MYTEFTDISIPLSDFFDVRLLDCLEDEELSSLLTDDPNVRVHLISMGSLNYEVQYIYSAFVRYMHKFLFYIE